MIFGNKQKEETHISFTPTEPQRDNNILTRGIRSYKDIIYPSAIDATSPDYVLINGTFTAVILCLDFPYYVRAAWLDDIINAGEGIEISLFHYPQNKTTIIKDLTYHLGFTKNKINTGGDNQADSTIQENALTHAVSIRKGLSEGDDFYYIHLLVKVSAQDKDTLLHRLKTAEAILAGKEIAFLRADCRQMEAYISTLPFCNLHDIFKEETARNALTGGVASMYPFTSFALSDPNGILIGVNRHNGSAVMLDIFNTKKHINANMALLGTSGAGKTFTLQLLASRMRLQGIPIMMICPLKGFEYKRLCEKLGGNYIAIEPGSKQCINILDIRPTSGEGNRDGSLLAAKLQKLQIFFSLMFPEIGYRERQILDDKLIKIYADKGITDDNCSLYLDDGEQGLVSFKPKLKEMPILGDLYEEILKDPDLANIAITMKPYITGSLSFFNSHTNIDLDNDYIVADISNMQGEAIPLAMFLTLDIFWDRVKQNITQKKCIILDEAWKLMGTGGNKLTAEFVLEIFKTIRGYGGSAIAATQDISDFLALENGKYGKGIINNAGLKMILKLEDYEVATLKTVLGLSEEESVQITKFPQGHGLLYAGSNHVAIQFLASPAEHRLISTNRLDIEKYRKEEGLI